MGTEMVLETLVLCRHLMQLIAQEDFIKLQWFQNPNQINGYNLISIRYKISRTWRNKREGISE
jgi:hypothetical protein